jgi:hypothetical protein
MKNELLLHPSPQGNAFQRWKWCHRYFLWTWSITGAALWFLSSLLTRQLLEPFSLLTLYSYLAAVPVAIALAAAYCLVIVALGRHT